MLSTSPNEFAAWVLSSHVPLSYGQICALVSLVPTIGFYLFMRFWLRDVVDRLFSQLSTRSYSLLPIYPCISLVALAIGTDNVFSPRSLISRGTQDILFFMALCAMILILYAMILGNILEITCRRKTKEGLQFARQLIGKQREHYNQALDYIEQVRIIKHDFRYRIHALQNMEEEEWDRYLKNLREELDRIAQTIFCQNQAVDELLQEYAARARQEDITFETKAGPSVHVPVDDLTLCVVIGNLLENASEACRHISGVCFIRVQAWWVDDHPMMVMENSYDGQITQRGGKVLSSKKDGDLDMLNIRRTLSHLGGEFDVDYNGIALTAMVKTVDRTMAEQGMPKGRTEKWITSSPKRIMMSIVNTDNGELTQVGQE